MKLCVQEPTENVGDVWVCPGCFEDFREYYDWSVAAKD
jgi:hypothetical protein